MRLGASGTPLRYVHISLIIRTPFHATMWVRSYVVYDELVDLYGTDIRHLVPGSTKFSSLQLYSRILSNALLLMLLL